jgi:hypothetical protein
MVDLSLLNTSWMPSFCKAISLDPVIVFRRGRTSSSTSSRETITSLPGGLHQFQPFFGRPAPEIVEFGHQAEVFVFLLFQLRFPAFPWHFLFGYRFIQVRGAGCIFVSINIKSVQSVGCFRFCVPFLSLS